MSSFCLGKRASNKTEESSKQQKVQLELNRYPKNQTESALVPPIVHEVLRSSGRPLDPETRTFMESRFCYDFSHVRIHTDAQAAESTRAINANAFTVGRDVVFGAGKYSPNSDQVKRLLAHELSHVVQQNRAGGPDKSGILLIDDIAGPSEHEAYEVASNMLLGVKQVSQKASSIDRCLIQRAVPSVLATRAPSTGADIRSNLTRRELELTDNLIMDFDDFEQTLTAEMRDARVSAPLIDLYLRKTTGRIRKITEPLPSRAATIPIIAKLVNLYRIYLNYLGGSGVLLSLIQLKKSLQHMYRRFRDTLSRVAALPGVGAEVKRQRAEERKVREEKRRREEAAQWVSEIIPYPESPTSLIAVGEFSDPWRVYKIHRRGEVYAINEENLQTSVFTASQWYSQRGLSLIKRSTNWLRILGQNPVIQFLAGLMEGIGESIVGLVKAVIRIDQTILAIGRALANLGETGRAIKKSLVEWYKQFVRGGAPKRARMIGKLIGSLIFEVALTKGIGRITMVKRAAEAARALKSRSLTVVKESLDSMRSRAVTVAPAVLAGIKGALQLLRRTGILRASGEVLKRSIAAVRGKLRVGREWFLGTLRVAKDGYYFLFDKAQKWVASIGKRLDEWAWEQRKGFVSLSALGAGSIDDLAAALYRKLKRSGAELPEEIPQIPPKKPRVRVEPTVRGAAIEVHHLEQIACIKLPNWFKTIDGVIGGKYRAVKEKGRIIHEYINAKGVSVKSTQISNPTELLKKIRTDLDDLRKFRGAQLTEGGVTVRVGKLNEKCLDLIFEEGTVVNKEMIRVLDLMKKEAGRIKFRWYIYSAGRKYYGPDFLRQQAKMLREL